MNRLVGLAAVAVSLVACNGDDFAVGRATGVFDGIGGSCECYLDGSDGLYPGALLIECHNEYIYLYYPEGRLNETIEGEFTTLTGWGGTGIYEVGSGEDRDGVFVAPLWIDVLVAPPQDACQTYIGGYYDYYAYDVCEPFEGGELHDGRIWCAL